MKVSLEVLRIQKVDADTGSPRLKVGAMSDFGVWQVFFPIEFGKHLHVGEELEMEIKVGP